MKKIFHILLISFISFSSCRKKDLQNVPQAPIATPIDPLLNSEWGFKVGSYWIFQNPDSTIDSIYVTVFTENIYDVYSDPNPSGPGQGTPPPFGYIYSEVNFGGNSNVGNFYLQGITLSLAEPIGEYSLPLLLYTKNGIKMDLNSNVLAPIIIYNSDSTIHYDNVYLYTYHQNKFEYSRYYRELTDSSRFFLKPNIGIVRKEIHLPDGNYKKIELIRYHIVK